MKRYGNLWPEIIDFDNLLLAARNAQRGKRYRDNVLAFNANLASELTRLQTELNEQRYVPGGYHTFEIRDPKPRLISAAPYRDRVVHHALCNVIQWRIERSFIHDSYANRLGYGTHRALKRFTTFARSHRYVLQCDIRKYFPSIDREILKTLLRRKLKCPQTLWLADTIIDASVRHGDLSAADARHFPGDELLTPLERRRGLPIGNLTSQFFANLYLNGLDHFVNEQLRVPHYLRYADDFALFSNDRAQLVAAREAIAVYLETLRLQLHPIKTQLFETRHGANFVGFRVLGDRVRVRNDNLQRSRRRLRKLQREYGVGAIAPEKIAQRLQSWDAHLRHGDTYRLRQCIFANLRFELLGDRDRLEPTECIRERVNA
ncbi:Retron-type reverse transcriptase [Rubidibacter lacunae KORDI 51-2]|uniref:Retron-type reverse transcriptase n=1 Tax=Rubidibacter lacunae KORDI 51-2 TaxID=582515 RepID=U5DJ63_9CHRO|nr:RNA-directed DNA polymerase [Rubidibacter lacunae]ERN41726.1 Retron-type reverse transcriptase [Rubidibacter lacunae KORDI 51-2]